MKTVGIKLQPQTSVRLLNNNFLTPTKVTELLTIFQPMCRMTDWTDYNRKGMQLTYNIKINNKLYDFYQEQAKYNKLTIGLLMGIIIQEAIKDWGD